MSNSVKWIKLSTAMFDDEKIRLIEQLPEGDTILVIWVKLLVLAGRKNSRGEIFVSDAVPYTLEMLSTLFGRKPNSVRLALKTFEEFRMIEVLQDKTILISNWGKHQNLDALEKMREKTRARVERHRAQARLPQNGLHSEVTLPSRYSNVTEKKDVTLQSVTVTPLERREESISPTEIYREEKEEAEASSLSASAAPEKADPSEPDRLTLEEVVAVLGPLSAQRFGTRLPAELGLWPRITVDTIRDQLGQGLSRSFLELIDWAYRLPKEHAIFEKRGAHMGLVLRTNFDRLVQNLVSEGQKIASARESAGLRPLHNSSVITPPCEAEPADWRDLLWKECPTVSLPEKWADLAQSLKNLLPGLRQKFAA